MRALELKVPPPVVAALIAAAMWAAASAVPSMSLPGSAGAAVALVVAGLGTAVGGVVSLRRAKTTIHPMKPENASVLVTSGIYRLTRNPMYLGLLLVLSAWAVFLSSPWLLAGPLAFAAYITRFQVLPEERALLRVFGPAYSTYQHRVRRWL